MKTDDSSGTVIKSGDRETSKYKIKLNGKAFKLMFTGIYSDPIRAIVRELIANGIDAQKMAGCADRPLKMTLPSSLDEMFIVRDYGVSMTHDFVMNRYNTAMDSTKDESNDEIGGFGLGAKTPLVYGDLFQLRCFLDGEVRFYTIYYDEDGIPAVSFIDKQKTDEENGVEVSFPVKPEDFSTFVTKAAIVCKTMPVRPSCSNTRFNDICDSFKRNLVEICPGFSVAHRSESLNPESLSAVMGGIPYPIVLGEAFDQVEIRRLRVLWNNLQFHGLVDFNIGDLEITPSRESLRYTDATIAKLREKLFSLADTVKEMEREAIKKCTLYDIANSEALHFNKCNTDEERRLYYLLSADDGIARTIGTKASFGTYPRNMRCLISNARRVLNRYKASIFSVERLHSNTTQQGFGKETVCIETPEGDRYFYVLRGRTDALYLNKKIYFTQKKLNRAQIALLMNEQPEGSSRKGSAVITEATPKVIALMRRALGNPTQEQVEFVDLTDAVIPDGKVPDMPIMFAAKRSGNNFAWKNVSTNFIRRTGREIVVFIGDVSPTIFGNEYTRDAAANVMRAINNFQGLPAMEGCAYVFVPENRMERFKSIVPQFTTIEDKIMSIVNKLSKKEWEELLCSDSTYSERFYRDFCGAVEQPKTGKEWKGVAGYLSKKAYDYFMDIFNDAKADVEKCSSPYANFYRSMGNLFPLEIKRNNRRNPGAPSKASKKALAFYKRVEKRNPLLRFSMRQISATMNPRYHDYETDNLLKYVFAELNRWYPGKPLAELAELSPNEQQAVCA